MPRGAGVAAGEPVPAQDRPRSANGAAIVPLTREQVRSQRNAAAVEAVIQSYRDEEAG